MKKHSIFAEHIEGKALSQFYDTLKQSWIVQGALMPDAHMGKTLPIGAVVAADGVVVPSYVGFDIGCGMLAVPTTFSADFMRENKQAIFDAIYRVIPVGFNHNAKTSRWDDGDDLPRSSALQKILNDKGMRDLHSLGGGNHFIEIGEDETGTAWIVIHSGSRNLGHTVASHYMGVAAGTGRATEGHHPLDVSSADGKNYITDLEFCLAYALENRRGMVARVEQELQKLGDGKMLWDRLINRNHNHAEEKDGLWIHRKGATHAEAGMHGVIPGTMRDGSFVVEGLGNPDSLYSSSHGAGRVMGRAEAKRNLNLEAFRAEMAERGIQARVDEATLDESASAYKDIFEVMAMQKELVRVLHHVRPIINIKG